MIQRFFDCFKMRRIHLPLLFISLFLFVALILFLNITVNSQSLPRYDGLAFQNYYLILSQSLAGVSLKSFLWRVLKGEFFYNSLTPFLAYVNQALGMIFPSSLMLGFVNVLIIFMSSSVISVLFSVILFDSFSLSTSLLFFSLLMTQKVFWSLGNGWWDLRNDLAPALIVLMNYLAVVLMLLRARVLLTSAVVFFFGTLYLVLARPPMLVFLCVPVFISFLLILRFFPTDRFKRVKLSVFLLAIVTPVLLTLIPRMEGLKTYYFTMGYEAQQWTRFWDFWLRDLGRIYGDLSLYLWLFTLITLVVGFSKPVFLQNRFQFDSLKRFKLLLFLVPAGFTFAFLNYQGTYGNPYGYILLMISGVAGLATIANRPRFKGITIFICALIVFSYLSTVTDKISAQVNSDAPVIEEIADSVSKINQIAGADPYSVVFLTAGGTDCVGVDVLYYEHRIPSRFQTCVNQFHARQFGMETRLNGRGDLNILRTNLAAFDWGNPESVFWHPPKVKVASNGKRVFLWTLREGEADFNNESAYVYSHRVAKTIDEELIHQGAQKIFSSTLLHADVFELMKR